MRVEGVVVLASNLLANCVFCLL